MYTIEQFIDNGSKSNFYKLKGKAGRGFKSFQTKEDAEYAHSVQSELSEHNLAPKVYSQVGKIRGHEGRLTSWGYITERAMVLTPRGHEANCGCEICYNKETRYSKQICNLQSSMEDLGFNFGDTHLGNVGYVRRNGRKVLVCIDTGMESVGSNGECSCSYCQYVIGKQYV